MTGGTGPDDEVADLLDTAAVTAAVEARRAAREVTERARELATWDGTVRDLAERTATVTVATIGPGTHRGALVGAAADHLVLRLADGGLTVVVADAVVSLRLAPEQPVAHVPADGDRPPATASTLLEVLDRWREDGARCHVTTSDGGTERGRLRTVGEDVVSLVGSAGTVHLPAAAIVAVTIR